MTQRHQTLRLSLTYLLAALLLIGMFGLALGSSRDKSPVLPESRTIDVLASLGLVPVPSAATISQGVFIARFPAILIGLLLAALMFRWGKRVYGLWPGIIALTMVAFSPTILAFSQLAVADLAGASLALASLYAWTRLQHHPQHGRAIFSGVLAGLALGVSTLSITLVISLVILTAWHIIRPEHGHRSSIGLLLIPWLSLAVTVTVVYGLWQGLSILFPALSGLASLPFGLVSPPGQSGYLLGSFTANPWSYLLLLLLKLTIPDLLMLALAAVLITMRGVQHHEWDYIFPVVVHMLVVTPFLLPALEMRYLLFVIPLLALFASRAGASTLPAFSWRRMIAAGIIAGAQISIALGAYPYYLPYFNFIGGGSENGYLLASGSNLDWGQSLPGLAAYIHDHNISQINLSYFGAADPADYGINATWLPSSNHPADVQFPPLDPPSGIYAISASNLVGVSPGDSAHETYAWFLSQKPMAVIGHSLFIYGVPPDPAGPGEWAAVCASPDPAMPDNTIHELSGMPALPVFNFDCRQSLAVPHGTGWVVLPPDVDPIVDLGDATFVAQDGTRVWKLPQPPPEPPSTIASPQTLLPLPIADHLELLGYTVSAPIIQAGQTLVLTEWWRVRQPPLPPVSISARLITIDASGAQQDILPGDALGLRVELWQPGMTIIQKHALSVSADFPPGEYWLTVGLLDVSTGRHFPISENGDQTIDRIVLQKITVTSSNR